MNWKITKKNCIFKAECDNCKKIFDICFPLNKKTENMTMKEHLKNLFGKVIILCPKCKNKR